MARRQSGALSAAVLPACHMHMPRAGSPRLALSLTASSITRHEARLMGKVRVLKHVSNYVSHCAS